MRQAYANSSLTTELSQARTGRNLVSSHVPAVHTNRDNEEAPDHTPDTHVEHHHHHDGDHQA